MADLYFYDSTDSRKTREAQAVGRDQRYTIRGVTGFGEVLTALDEYISQHRTFSTIYFGTHGSPGAMFLPNGSLTTTNASSLATRSGIFEGQGRVLFLGCSVAEGDDGWRFLEAIGRFFVRDGFVGASTSPTYGESTLPAWGILRIIQVVGGAPTRRVTRGRNLAYLLEWIFG